MLTQVWDKFIMWITYPSFWLRRRRMIRAELKELVPEATTVPQIFVGKRHIGGYDDFKVYAEESLEGLR